MNHTNPPTGMFLGKKMENQGKLTWILGKYAKLPIDSNQSSGSNLGDPVDPGAVRREHYMLYHCRNTIHNIILMALHPPQS